MALADRRPLGIPVSSAHAAPAFNTDGLDRMTRKIPDLKGYTENDIPPYTDGSISPTEMSPNSRSISPDSLMNGVAKKSVSSNSSRGSTPPNLGSNPGSASSQISASSGSPGSSAAFYDKAGLSSSILGKKAKAAARVPIATGISTTIPVTGEKPKPTQHGDASLEDDVLYAIFLILYEKDTPGAGMTVKQICDVLVERHPDMAQLSSKTSNLVSAKLNAYVKRVEKGDSNLRYALSREWADASPKRMVYVYRGLLAKDFHVHVKKMERSERAEKSDKPKTSPGAFSTDSFEAARQSALSKPRRQTMFDLGISRHAFSDPADAAALFVPYSSAPVAANMTTATATHETPEPEAEQAEPTPVTESKKLATDSDFDFDDLEVFNDTDDDMEYTDAVRKGKRSKSMSHLSSKKAKFVTAAAAAPRVPRAPCSHSPHAAAAAAALHAAALKAIAAATSSSEKMAQTGRTENGGGSGSVSPRSTTNWAHAVRSGFLTQEIGAPEDVSLSDLDKLFG